MILDKERTGIEKKFYDVTQEIVEQQGFVLYDMDYIAGSKTLRVFIMNSETRTAVIDDCVKIDKAFTPFMEENDWIPEEITLEVSSPGLFRNLSTRQHFSWAMGENIQVQLQKNLGDLVDPTDLDKKVAKTKKFVAKLEKIEEESIVVQLDNDFSLRLKLEDIKKVNLEPDVNKTSR